MIQTFRALGVRNYRIYFLAALVSNAGTWMQRVAQDWLVLDLTGNSGTALGITTGLQFLPILLITPYGGLLADRFPKRLVLALTQTAMAVAAGVLGVLTITGAVEVWHVYVLAFAVGIGSALDMPVRQSFVVEMVGPEILPNAVALNSAAFNAARVVGPALAGLLIVVVGTGWVIALNALSYAAVIWALQRMRADELEPSDPAIRTPGMIREGMRYVRTRPDLLLVLAVVFFLGTFGMNFQMTSALMATEVYGVGAGAYGVLGSVMAIGSLSGALLAARRGQPRLRLVVVGAILFGIVQIAAGLMPTYLTFAIWLPLVGITAMTVVTAANTTMQLGVVPQMRGRVMALYMTVFMGGTPLGAPIIGWIGETFGARWTLGLGGALTIIGTLAATLWFSRRSGMRLQTTLEPLPRLRGRSPAPPPAVAVGQ